MTKNNLFLTGMLALALGLVFIGCDDGGSSSGDTTVIITSTPYLGDEFTLTGQVVTEGDDFNYTNYTGDKLDVSTEPSVSDDGTVTNGKLGITIKKPAADSLGAISGLKESYEDIYTSVTISNNEANYAQLSLFAGNSSITRELSTFNETSMTMERVDYIYVDTNVTITATAKTTPGENQTMKTTDTSLSLQAGWNTVYMKAITTIDTDTDTDSYTTTASQSLYNPDNLKWVLN